MSRKIKIIGLGGIGSYLAEPLCRYLSFIAKHPGETIPQVTLIDGDKYEDRNRDRQQFDRCENKAVVTSDMLRKKFTNVTFRAKDEFVTEENVISLIRENDIVFMCVDNHATRKLVSDRCGELDNVTLISGGNERTDGNVFYHRRADGEDMNRPPTAIDHKIANPEDKNPGEEAERRGCEQMVQDDPQLLITNFAAASHMLNVFYAHLNGNANFEQVFFDITTQRSRPSPEQY